MIDRRSIFEIHRLKNLGWSARKIASELRRDRATVKKYLEEPRQAAAKKVSRGSKLDPYRELIDEYLEQDPEVKAPVVLQRLSENGFDGKISIVRNYLKKLRGQKKGSSG